MAHRVVNLDSEVVDASTADGLQQEIKNHLDTEGYALREREVNDGTVLKDSDEVSSLGVNVEFEKAKEANVFFDHLKVFVRNNEQSFDRARLRAHDCMHAEDGNEPCKIGNIWQL